MYTVIETSTYSRKAKTLLTEVQQQEVIGTIAADPQAGELISGTGGFRKIRIATGSGKSGGARVIYYYAQERTPVILAAIYGKNEASNISGAGKAALLKLAEEFKRQYGR